MCFAGSKIMRDCAKTSLAKAIGVKRANLVKAAKTRSKLDADLAEKIPMGI